ncbi:MAG: membrane protein insertion efficiency factor YidD [Bdellovibrionales bacterium]|nr:membrane protein insertion efficiency factor YidD [Bdellovibrionales bacterium]
MNWFMVLILNIYRVFFSSWLVGVCRHQPSCSLYALQASQRHPPLRALVLIFNRVCRCHPWGTYGFDPVPISKLKERPNE